MKTETEPRENLAKWCRKYPNWLLKVLWVALLPIFIFAPMFGDGSLVDVFKEWWRLLHITYKDSNA